MPSMQQCEISLKISNTDTSIPLGVEVWVDDNQLLDCDHVQETLPVKITLADNEGSHELRVILKNKITEHTKIDKQGNILSDARIKVSDVMFDQIELGQILIDRAVYEHDFNGNGPVTQDKFYGEMGCNGVFSLKFSTPIYVWLLENI